MYRFLTLALLALFSFNSFAATVPVYQDIKPPTQKMVEYQAFANIAAASSTYVKSADAGPTSAAAASITSFTAQPDFPRNISITPGGTTADVAACAITVSGTDYLNNSISETFSFIANQSTIINGMKAFKSVVSVSFPASCEDSPFGATWNIGIGESVGVKRCMDKAGHILFSTLNGAKEGTAPTMAADESVVSLNTADFNGTMNGSNDFELFFMQNFRCTR